MLRLTVRLGAWPGAVLPVAHQARLRATSFTPLNPYILPTAFPYLPPPSRSSDVEAWVNNFAPPLPRMSIRTSNTRLVNIYSDTAKQLADVRWGHPCVPHNTYQAATLPAGRAGQGPGH